MLTWHAQKIISPLFIINQLVDSTSGLGQLTSKDAYSCSYQIPMGHQDQDHTTSLCIKAHIVTP